MRARQTNERLGELAGRTRRARSVIADEAVAAYVEHELAIVEGIARTRARVREGEVVTHDEVAREARAVVAAARAGR